MNKHCSMCFKLIQGKVHEHEGKWYCSVSHLNRGVAAHKQAVKDVKKTIAAFNAKHA